MSFVVLPKQIHSVIREGEARLGKDGVLALTAGDLKSVRIDGFAVLLIDVQTRRIALRAPRDSDRLDARKLTPNMARKGHSPSIFRIKIEPAIRALKIKVDIARTYRASVKDDLLIIDFNQEIKGGAN